MFKDYKEIFKTLREVQDQLWKDSMARFPTTSFQNDMSEWQQQTIESVNNMVGQAIGQSLELQQQWLAQWSERAGDRKLKPGTFAELSADARNSTKNWLDNQSRLWDQWLQVHKTRDPGAQPDLAEWEAIIQESIQRQMTLLSDWSEMADFEKLSTKQMTKLSNQIAKSMQSSIELQQQLWSHWFSGLGEAGAAAGGAHKAVPPAPRKKRKKATASNQDSSKASAQPGDDLKQISGIGAGLEKKLRSSGITTLSQIAGLSDADIVDLEERIIRFSGRIKREKWVEQARKLIS